MGMGLSGNVHDGTALHARKLFSSPTHFRVPLTSSTCHSAHLCMALMGSRSVLASRAELFRRAKNPFVSGLTLSDEGAEAPNSATQSSTGFGLIRAYTRSRRRERINANSQEPKGSGSAGSFHISISCHSCPRVASGGLALEMRERPSARRALLWPSFRSTMLMLRGDSEIIACIVMSVFIGAQVFLGLPVIVAWSLFGTVII
ncbi:hypothetical protein BC826DRAFT_514098 [Russula brevipes]|nr:hypothetical protein BC826DRAFT_514098 [Russula brevipes]